jgi:hypothetical protein
VFPGAFKIRAAIQHGAPQRHDGAAGIGQGKNMLLSCFLAVAGSTIVPPQWPDRPALWDYPLRTKE